MAPERTKPPKLLSNQGLVVMSVCQNLARRSARLPDRIPNLAVWDSRKISRLSSNNTMSILADLMVSLARVGA